MQRSLGLELEGLAPPIPDANDSVLIAVGACKRLGTPLPVPTLRHFKRRFRLYARVFIRTYIKPLGCVPILSLYEWMEGSSYTEKEKKAIIDAAMEEGMVVGPMDRENFEVASFMKKETFLEPKFPRMINPRSVLMKFRFNLFIAMIEKHIKHFGMLAKGCDHDWLRTRILNMNKFLGVVCTTDFTSFERHVSAWIAKTVEVAAFKHFFSASGQHFLFEDFLRDYERAVCSSQKCTGKYVGYNVRNCRMSGEGSTSIGNGLTNCIMMGFAMSLCGYDYRRIAASTGNDAVDEMAVLFEGDDGRMVLPERLAGMLTDALFTSIGMNVKIQKTADPDTADFLKRHICSTSGQMFADAQEVLIKAGWTHSDFIHSGQAKCLGLLKAKAQCTLSEMPNSPILAEWAKAVLRLTNGVKAITETFSGKQNWKKLFSSSTEPLTGVAFSTRMAYARTFGVSVDAQLEVEEWFKNLSGLRPVPRSVWSLFCLNDKVVEACQLFHEEHVVEFKSLQERTDKLIGNYRDCAELRAYLRTVAQRACQTRAVALPF